MKEIRGFINLMVHRYITDSSRTNGSFSTEAHQPYYDNSNHMRINYDDDEYDDLVDYEKKPLFIDEESSNSESEEEEKKHRPSNSNNPQLIKKVYERETKNAKKKNKAKYDGMSWSEIGKAKANDEELRYIQAQKEKEGRDIESKGNNNQSFKKNKPTYVEKNRHE